MPKVIQEKNAASRVGRPRAFDENQALDAAMGVFATSGFEAASLTALTEAMGINRVSMYATFGNKESLFIRAFERYTRLAEEHGARCLATGSAKQGLLTLLKDCVERFTSKERDGVCFMTQSPLVNVGATLETSNDFSSKRNALEALLQRHFERAVEKGELPDISVVKRMASFYTVVIHGMALQAQHGTTREELLDAIDVAISAWPARGKAVAK
ncbi:TetR/AcrR family transcriptional regulator [Rouxiella silvae]|uniref:TetR/AcrR family transcriptional regulator n=1 Tax=Rouxiella silvae TaxID=1646373 RepID=A0AA40X1P3_9GAMM|nr:MULTISPECIES: TetR/AcrR family transcriptional regulator [Rouxiella]KAB7896551.1 TetR family transcriptional regulator [Rouxiella sp. S1S-2]MBF6637130.1 TetR/AcrR family transcriptional regulator [Rouxiella silvae]